MDTPDGVSIQLPPFRHCPAVQANRAVELNLKKNIFFNKIKFKKKVLGSEIGGKFWMHMRKKSKKIIFGSEKAFLV